MCSITGVKRYQGDLNYETYLKHELLLTTTLILVIDLSTGIGGIQTCLLRWVGGGDVRQGELVIITL